MPPPEPRLSGTVMVWPLGSANADNNCRVTVRLLPEPPIVKVVLSAPVVADGAAAGRSLAQPARKEAERMQAKTDVSQVFIQTPFFGKNKISRGVFPDLIHVRK